MKTKTKKMKMGKKKKRRGGVLAALEELGAHDY